MGKSGDQDIHWAQNATLAESDYNGVDVHLFEVIDAGEYIYCGRIELVSKPYTDVQPGEDGNNRKVWMFPIRPVPDNDVKKPQMFVFKDMDDYENRGKNVDAEYTKMMAVASSFLKPKAQQFKKLLQDYQTAVQLKKERAAIEALMQELNTDALNQGQPEENSPRINLIEYVDADKWKKWSDTFATIVEECHYPNFVSARIAKNTYDAVVNKKHKASEGKGYRAFLNSIILFALMKTLEEEGTYRSGMLILDSPILTLKEKKKISQKELASPGMRESLFRYFVNNCGDNQITIAENEIPANVDYSTANLIEFTHDKSVGTYGFLRSIDINKES